MESTPVSVMRKPLVESFDWVFRQYLEHKEETKEANLLELLCFLARISLLIGNSAEPIIQLRELDLPTTDLEVSVADRVEYLAAEFIAKLDAFEANYTTP